MKRSILLLVFVLTFIGIGLNISAAMATDDQWGGAHEGKRFRAHLQTTSKLVMPPPPGRCDDRTGHDPVIGLLEVVGAGDATFLGPVVDEQSHCVREDGSFFGGVFRLKNDDGQTIQGRYFGHLKPTFNPPDSAGVFLIIASVCIVGRDINQHCSAHDYEPARGITNLSTGDATIYLDQIIGGD
jgi:hypothetical protein